ncbi:LamG-like jellyroll fold domain-containing protein [Soonwooa sp.]|uniref:LamG-like jellyroll fold domain-containing protein n=1 Tax=Soonwooa sp. TaxID=1938592 RepID=UPI00289FE7DF|nr:LamG-like jellyroll fold domain-containing protein [Soonwooa sp.]
MKTFFQMVCLGVCLFLGIPISAQTILVDNLNAPYDVIADQDGSIYISDTGNRRIIKTNADGSNPIVLNTFSGNVYGLLISNNKLFALVGGNLMKMNLDGTNPEIIAPAPGVYYLTSGNDNHIYFIGNQSKNLQKVKEDGTGHTNIASLISPMGITYDPNLDLLYYTDNGAVYSIKKDGTDRQLLVNGFYNPHNLRLDSSGNIYLAVTSSNWIRKISADRKTVTTFPNTTLNAPTSTFVTKNGRILVADTWGAKIRYIDAPAATTLNFDGINDYISGTNSFLPQGSAERTIEAVIKAPSVRTSPYTSSAIFNYGTYANSKRFCLMLSNGNLAFVGEFNDTTSPYNLRDDQWHHVAVTLKNSTIKLYVDGVLVQSATMNLNTTGTSFLIGGSERNGIDEHFEGDIDEVRIWNRALSENELKNSKSCEVANPVSQDGLVSYFKFNQGNNEADNSAVTTLVDETGKSNSVTLNNFALAGTKSNWLLASPIVTGNSCPQYVSPLSCATVTVPSNGTSPNGVPTVSWLAVNGATSYKVFVGKSSGKYDLVSAYVTSTTYQLQGLEENTTYFVKIVPDSSTETAIGCSESSFTTGSFLSINDLNKKLISVYPNPFVDVVNISNLDSIASISINDNSGKTIKNLKPEKSLNLSSLSKGLYIINLKMMDGTTKSFKVIKK